MIITRYLLRNLFLASLFIGVTLTVVIWLTQSLKLLELVANSDAPPGLFLKLVLLSLPRFLEIILPLSLVVAVLFTYNRLIMDNELIVMRACGANQMTLARPALALGIVITVILLSLTTYFSPKSKLELAQMRHAVKARYSAFLLREGVFNTFGKNLTVYLRRRSADGALYGLLIHDTRDKDKPPVTVTAKKGHIIMDDTVPTIVVFDGMRQQFDRKTGSVSKLLFSKYTIEIQHLDTGGERWWQDVDERTLTELMNPDMTSDYDRQHRNAFRAEVHNRIVTPFNAIGFALIALPCVLLGSFNRRGQGRKILLAAVAVTAAQVANMSLVNIMQTNPVFIPVLYAATFIPIALGLWLLHQPGEQMLMAILRRWRRRGFEKAEAGA